MIREKYGSKLVIIGLTGNIMPEDVIHFREQGANGMLFKPLNVDDFLTILEQIQHDKRTDSLDEEDNDGDDCAF